MVCSLGLLIKCNVVTCFRHGAANASGCERRVRGRGGRRVRAYICPWCFGLRGTWGERRKRAGLSIGQAAKLLGVSQVDLAAIELGTPAPSALELRMRQLYSGLPVDQVCRACGCTDDDCRGCIERTGGPCSWIEPDLCSACSSSPAASKQVPA